MGQTEISSEFEYSASFLRILIPGIIFVTLFSLLILKYFGYDLNPKESIEVWSLISIGGIFILISITRVYKLSCKSSLSTSFYVGSSKI